MGREEGVVVEWWEGRREWWWSGGRGGGSGGVVVGGEEGVVEWREWWWSGGSGGRSGDEVVGGKGSDCGIVENNSMVQLHSCVMLNTSGIWHTNPVNAPLFYCSHEACLF